jgi:polynucleotide 5'-kinase involved in rRNA processing
MGADDGTMENKDGPSAEPSRPTEESSSPEDTAQKKPVCLIVLGMAGSGKTTFVQVMQVCGANQLIIS